MWNLNAVLLPMPVQSKLLSLRAAVLEVLTLKSDDLIM